VSVGGLSCSGGLHAVVIVIKQQLSLTAMSNDGMEFVHLQPHAQLPDDYMTIDYRYDLLDRISVYNVRELCRQNQRLHLLRAIAFNYRR